MQPTEQVKCGWCERKDIGTGHELSVRGWVSVRYSRGLVMFFCDGCWYCGPVERPENYYVQRYMDSLPSPDKIPGPRPLPRAGDRQFEELIGEVAMSLIDDGLPELFDTCEVTKEGQPEGHPS